MRNLFNYICGLVLMVLIMLAVSCNTQKHITTESTFNDSAYHELLKKQVTEKNKEISYLKSKIAEYEYQEVLFNSEPCPEVNTDSIKQVLAAGGCKQSTVDSIIAEVQKLNNSLTAAKAQVKFYKDGSIEASGKIARITKTKLSVEEQLKAAITELDRLTVENRALQGRVIEAESKKVKEVVRKTAWGVSIILILAALVVGFIGGLRAKKQTILNQ